MKVDKYGLIISSPNYKECRDGIETNKLNLMINTNVKVDYLDSTRETTVEELKVEFERKGETPEWISNFIDCLIMKGEYRTNFAIYTLV